MPVKIITNDYNSGTSSAILDSDYDNVLVVSPDSYQSIYNLNQEDILFIGHDFLSYLWSTPELIDFWKHYKGKKIVWAFEKIDSVIPAWREKSHHSISICKTIMDEVVASDETDCRKYGYRWLPQWASRKFYDLRHTVPTETRVTFSGQMGNPSYSRRDRLIEQLRNDREISSVFYVSNNERSKTWDDYIHNFLNHFVILAPFGNIAAFNTRTYEALISGRILLQQVNSDYRWHIESLAGYRNVLFFRGYKELKNLLRKPNLLTNYERHPQQQYLNNNLEARLQLLV